MTQPTKSRRQRGAVLIETALTAPLVFLMIFGLVELSFMLKDHLTLRAVAQDATRTATVAGDDIDADFRILATAVETGATLPDGSITRIVVYRANSADAPVPPACLLSGQSSATVKCNSYVPLDFTRPESDFGCDPLLALDRSWCPADRVVVRSPASGGPPDYIGIHVVLERDLLTGMFGGTQTLEATYVLRVEPRNL